jgi:hypothetical protein
MRTKFYASLSVAFIIIAVNYYAGIYNVYWLFSWFDIPMHIAGGFMVGLFAQTGIDHVTSSAGVVWSEYFARIVNYFGIHKRRVFYVLLSVVIVGVVWEGLEFYLGLTDGLGPLSRFDTIKDLIDDIIGGVLSIWFWNFIFNKTKITKIHDK